MVLLILLEAVSASGLLRQPRRSMFACPANNEFNVWEVGNRTKMSVGIGYNATNRLEISYDYTNLENAYISRFYSTATLHFDMNGTDHMVIDSTGNVGIGSSSPAAPLDVAKSIRL